jgi:hypothetical protein
VHVFPHTMREDDKRRREGPVASRFKPKGSFACRAETMKTLNEWITAPLTTSGEEEPAPGLGGPWPMHQDFSGRPR